MANSLRKRIIKQIEETLRASLNADPAAKFRTEVETGPLGAADHKKKRRVGIVPVRETYRDSFPLQERRLEIALEYTVTINQKEDPALYQLEDMLTEIENIVVINKTWNEASYGPLAYETVLMGNETDMYSHADKAVFGMLQIAVLYRHSHEDVTNPNPDTP